MSKKPAREGAGRPAMKPDEKVKRVGVTLRPSQIAHAEARASSDFGGNLSRYFQHIVDADMTGAPAAPLESRVENLEARVQKLEKPQ